MWFQPELIKEYLFYTYTGMYIQRNMYAVYICFYIFFLGGGLIDCIVLFVHHSYIIKKKTFNVLPKMTQGPPGRSFSWKTSNKSVMCWGPVVALAQTRVSSLTMDADKNAKKRRSSLGLKRSMVRWESGYHQSLEETNPIIYDRVFAPFSNGGWLGMGFLSPSTVLLKVET